MISISELSHLSPPPEHQPHPFSTILTAYCKNTSEKRLDPSAKNTKLRLSNALSHLSFILSSCNHNLQKLSLDMFNLSPLPSTTFEILSLRGLTKQPSHTSQLQFLSHLKSLKILLNARDLPQYIQIINKSKYQKNVDVSFYEYLGAKEMGDVRELRNGVNLSLNGFTLDEEQGVMEKLRELGENLRQIRLVVRDPWGFIDILNKCPKLKRLQIFNKKDNVDYKFNQTHLSSLTSTISSFNFADLPFSIPHFSSFTSNNPCITQLVLSQCSITTAHIQRIPQHLQSSITKFSFKDSPTDKLITFSLIEHIIQFPNIRFLFLQNCEGIGNRAVQIVCLTLLELKEFRLRSCELNDRGLVYLKKLKMLTEFNVLLYRMQMGVFFKGLVNLKRVKECCKYVFKSNRVWNQDGREEKRGKEGLRALGVTFK